MSVRREASCRCGLLTAVAIGEPVRVSVCHCMNCKRRSGSAFSYNATLAKEKVVTSGASTRFSHSQEGGYWGELSFCPTCGSTVTYEIERRPGMVTIPAGAFADSAFREPTVSVYGERRHAWCVLQTNGPLEEA